MFGNFFHEKRVLVTGHTGFKGSWLSIWLHSLGARVYGFSLPPDTEPSLFEIAGAAACHSSTVGDVRDQAAVARTLEEAKPDVVFHLAAQSLVLRSYREPLLTLETNVMGTAHLLEALRGRTTPCAVVVVTSDKCYQNRGADYAYCEADPLGGADVYSMSKAAAELVVHAWRSSFFGEHPVRVATARAGNVIGGGDFAADRILPDCVRSLAAGQPIRVRNPGHVRPWQHVLESLSGYLWLAVALASGEPRGIESFNFGPNAESARPVHDVVAEVLRHWPGSWEPVGGGRSESEAPILQLSIGLAEQRLGWRPVWDFERAIEATIEWYQRWHDRRIPMADYCLEQIAAYTEQARRGNLAWAA